MRFTKAKIVAAGMILAGICMIAPQQLRAEVPKTQMDGVMGQSIKEEMDDTQISNVSTQNDGLLSTYAMPQLLGATKAASGYTQDFLDGSFTSKVDYTSVTYYHKSDYEDAQLLNGIDVSWWQAKNKKTTALNWEKIHDAGIDFAFVRVASRDTSDGSIYEDTAADSHIQAALENDINVGLYIFSQALTEKEAKQEAEYVLDLADKYGWDVTLPIVIDREKGSHNRLTGGKLSKAKETAVEKCVSQQEFRKISNENKSLREILEFTILLPEGFAAMRQISFVHDDPHLTYSHYMKLIDETITFIDKEYN